MIQLRQILPRLLAFFDNVAVLLEFFFASRVVEIRAS
jgi:hypothetical protein